MSEQSTYSAERVHRANVLGRLLEAAIRRLSDEIHRLDQEIATREREVEDRRRNYESGLLILREEMARRDGLREDLRIAREQRAEEHAIAMTEVEDDDAG